MWSWSALPLSFLEFTMTYMTPKNDRNLSVLFCWSLGPDQPGVPRRVGMSSGQVRISHFSRPFNDIRISSTPKTSPRELS